MTSKEMTFYPELFEVITKENLSELSPGDWIWDNSNVTKMDHSYSFDKTILEPIGFRQVHILNLENYPRFTSQPFMLSDIAKGYRWTYFEPNRFYKLKKYNVNDLIESNIFVADKESKDNVYTEQKDTDRMMAVMAGVIFKLANWARTKEITDQDLDNLASICEDLGYWKEG